MTVTASQNNRQGYFGFEGLTFWVVAKCRQDALTLGFLADLVLVFQKLTQDVEYFKKI